MTVIMAPMPIMSARLRFLSNVLDFSFALILLNMMYFLSILFLFTVILYRSASPKDRRRNYMKGISYYMKKPGLPSSEDVIL